MATRMSEVTCLSSRFRSAVRVGEELVHSADCTGEARSSRQAGVLNATEPDQKAGRRATKHTIVFLKAIALIAPSVHFFFLAPRPLANFAMRQFLQARHVHITSLLLFCHCLPRPLSHQPFVSSLCCRHRQSRRVFHAQLAE